MSESRSINQQRYHKAARDGLLDILKETTRKDCNAGDEDGMTPTLWAAFEGQLEALSLLVGRGGDPNKCDNYGNTALHLASARGHLDCVTFLINFGVNFYSLDIDMHTPQELAAMNDCSEILRYLDSITADFEATNPKKVKTMQDKAQKDADKLVKNFKKIQKKADKKNEKESKLLDKEMEKLMSVKNDINDSSEDLGSSSSGSLSTTVGPKFSEITSSSSSGSVSSNAGSGTLIMRSGAGAKLIGTVSKRLTMKKNQAKQAEEASRNDFTISEIEDGKRSVRHLRGRRQSENILFVPKKLDVIKDDHIDDQLDAGYVSSDKPLFLQNSRKSLAAGMTGGASIFDRPGIGSMAFRHSVSASLFSFNNDEGVAKENSIGSAGSLEADNEEEPVASSGFSAEAFAPVAIFLAGLGMQDWIKTFERERIDLEALTLIGDEELKMLGLPLGPRMKVLSAINERRKSMKDEQELADSQL